MEIMFEYQLPLFELDNLKNIHDIGSFLWLTEKVLILKHNYYTDVYEWSEDLGMYKEEPKYIQQFHFMETTLKRDYISGIRVASRVDENFSLTIMSLSGEEIFIVFETLHEAERISGIIKQWMIDKS